MPKDIVHIKQFHGGINDASETTDISDNECQVANECEFTTVGKIKLAGDLSATPATNPAAYATDTEPGKGLFAFTHNRNVAGTISNLDYYASHDDNQVKVWNSSDDWTEIVATSNWSEATGVDANFLFENGVLRISDGQLVAVNERRWWGYISRTIFPDATAEEAISAMTKAIADLTAPSTGDVVGSATYTANALNVKFTEATNGSIPESSNYKVAYSFVYDDVQESLLYEMSTAIDLTSENSLDSPEIYFKTSYDDRISGARIYIQDQNANEEDWLLLIDVDFNQGYRQSLGENYRGTFANGATAATDIKLAFVAGENITSLGAETYSSINGYKFDEPIDCSYKTAVVVDGITYAGNILQNGVTSPDKILKCAIGYTNDPASDVFPESNFLNITPNNGQPIIKLETYADRVLVFSKETLFVVNYNESIGDYLEDTYPYMGIVNTAHSFATAHGIVFMNNLGVHIYDGETVRTLTGKTSDLSLPEHYSPPSGGGGGAPNNPGGIK